MVWAEGQTCRVLRFFPTYLILGGLSAELNCARWFGSGCAIVFVIELNFPLLFPSMQVLIQMDRATQRLEPWKIAVIVVVVIAGLALIIGLLTFYLCHGKHTTFLLSQDFWNMLCFTWYCGLTWWFRYKIHPGIESTWEDVLDCTWVLNWLENLQEWLKYHLLEIGILVFIVHLFVSCFTVVPALVSVVNQRPAGFCGSHGGVSRAQAMQSKLDLEQSLSLLFVNSALWSPSLLVTREPNFPLACWVDANSSEAPASVSEGTYVTWCVPRCAHLRLMWRWSPEKYCSGCNIRLLGTVLKVEMNP